MYYADVDDECVDVSVNLLLVAPNEVVSGDQVTVTGRRAEHMRRVLHAKVGDVLKVGILNGNVGHGEIVSIDETGFCLKIACTHPPPNPSDIRLILALPRPKVARRVIAAAVGFGVKDIVLLGSYRVEKSYWSSPLVSDTVLVETATLSLEQVRDTSMPRITKYPRFKPFVEDVLPQFASGTRCLLFHPDGPRGAPSACALPTTVAIGPDGGWTSYEATSLQDNGFEWVHLGPRIHRVETVVSAILGRLSRV